MTCSLSSTGRAVGDQWLGGEWAAGSFGVRWRGCVTTSSWLVCLFRIDFEQHRRNWTFSSSSKIVCEHNGIVSWLEGTYLGVCMVLAWSRLNFGVHRTTDVGGARLMETMFVRVSLLEA
eukprot:TRINITY_DN7382_c0_g1_i2.p1 TRINITY_DN7382_c0_g1~~TRINITY_DN7382_c0_g1_i2.p1  ORF type:complete len:119 (+),score=4.40 TRINITY_DN7382_c0_g1_i2:315-671(+)